MHLTVFNTAALRYGYFKAGTGQFSHVFGGPPRHKGTHDPATGHDALPLLELDLADPNVGITIPRVTRLPIYYSFCNPRGQFAYRVISNSRIESLLPKRPGRPEPDEDTAAFFARHAAGLSRRPMTIDWRAFNPTNPQEVVLYGRLFRLDDYLSSLPAHSEQSLVRRIAESYRGLFTRTPRTMDEVWDELPDVFFPVGEADSRCQRTGCRGRRGDGETVMLLQFVPDDKDGPLYWAIGGDDSGQFQATFCPWCHTVVVSNPCT
jgi:hypothetical protein